MIYTWQNIGFKGKKCRTCGNELSVERHFGHCAKCGHAYKEVYSAEEAS